jgi:DNA gyrase subunit A
MIINKSGLTIRLRVDSLKTRGRATQGVKLINIKNNDAIASVAVVPVEEEEEVVVLDENGDPIVNPIDDTTTDTNSGDNAPEDNSGDNDDNGTTIE